MSEIEQLYTAEEAAARFKVSRQTVIRWIKSKRLAGFRTGTGRTPYRIRASEMNRFIAELEGRQEVAK